MHGHRLLCRVYCQLAIDKQFSVGRVSVKVPPHSFDSELATDSPYRALPGQRSDNALLEGEGQGLHQSGGLASPGPMRVSPPQLRRPHQADGQ